MSSNAFLLYESQSEVSGNTWYYLRVCLVHNSYEYLADFLLRLIGENTPDELRLLDIPAVVPSFVAAGTELNKYAVQNGTYVLPEDIYFMFGEGNPHIREIYPTVPDSEEVVLQASYLADLKVVYRDAPYQPPVVWPDGRDPSETSPDENGIVFPDPGDFGYTRKDVATRMLYPWYLSEVFTAFQWVYSACNDWQDDENHCMYNNPDEFWGNRWRWNEPNYIYHCMEDNPTFFYWLERETIGSIETLSIWVYEASTPAIYYPQFDTIVPSKRTPVFRRTLTEPDVIQESPQSLLLGSFFLKKFSIRDLEPLTFNGEAITFDGETLDMR